MDHTDAIVWYLTRVYRVDRDIERYSAKPWGLPGDCFIPF